MDVDRWVGGFEWTIGFMECLTVGLDSIFISYALFLACWTSQRWSLTWRRPHWRESSTRFWTRCWTTSTRLSPTRRQCPPCSCRSRATSWLKPSRLWAASLVWIISKSKYMYRAENNPTFRNNHGIQISSHTHLFTFQYTFQDNRSLIIKTGQGTIGFDGTILENDQSWLITMATLTNIPRRYSPFSF